MWNSKQRNNPPLFPPTNKTLPYTPHIPMTHLADTLHLAYLCGRLNNENKGPLLKDWPTQILGTQQAPSKVLERMGQHPFRVAFSCLWKAVVEFRRKHKLEKGKCHTHLRKEKKTINPWLPNCDAGSSPHGTHFWAHKGDDWSRKPWIYWRVNHVWPAWFPCVIKCWGMWVREICGHFLFGLQQIFFYIICHCIPVSEFGCYELAQKKGGWSGVERYTW